MSTEDLKNMSASVEEQAFDTGISIPIGVSPSSYSWHKKIAVVEKFMALGNLRLVSELEEVPYPTLTDWKKSEWWPQLVDEIRSSRRNVKARKMSDILDKGLDAIADRLENGDYVLNNKTGRVVRRPCSLRDIQAMTNNLLARQVQLEELADRMEHKNNNVQDTLTTLAKEFTKWAQKQQRPGTAAVGDVIDVVPKEQE